MYKSLVIRGNKRKVTRGKFCKWNNITIEVSVKLCEPLKVISRQFDKLVN